MKTISKTSKHKINLDAVKINQSITKYLWLFIFIFILQSFVNSNRLKIIHFKIKKMTKNKKLKKSLMKKKYNIDYYFKS